MSKKTGHERARGLIPSAFSIPQDGPEGRALRELAQQGADHEEQAAKRETARLARLIEACAECDTQAVVELQRYARRTNDRHLEVKATAGLLRDLGPIESRYEEDRYRNLLKETLAALYRAGKTEADVLHVIRVDPATEDVIEHDSWDNFVRRAARIYYRAPGPSHAFPFVSEGLKVVGDGWWLERFVLGHNIEGWRAMVPPMWNYRVSKAIKLPRTELEVSFEPRADGSESAFVDAVMMPCETCDGSGLLACQSCDGSGRIRHQWATTACACGGQVVRCERCRGTGEKMSEEHHVYWPRVGSPLVMPPRAYDPALMMCPGCGGDGDLACSCTDYDPLDMVPRMSTCERCGGSSRVTCGTCLGEGVIRDEETGDAEADREVVSDLIDASGTVRTTSFSDHTSMIRFGLELGGLVEAMAAGGEDIENADAFSVEGVRVLQGAQHGVELDEGVLAALHGAGPITLRLTFESEALGRNTVHLNIVVSPALTPLRGVVGTRTVELIAETLSDAMTPISDAMRALGAEVSEAFGALGFDDDDADEEHGDR